MTSPLLLEQNQVGEFYLKSRTGPAQAVQRPNGHVVVSWAPVRLSHGYRPHYYWVAAVLLSCSVSLAAAVSGFALGLGFFQPILYSEAFLCENFCGYQP